MFDKDGTLLDFHATWDPAVDQALRTTAPSARAAAAAATAIGFDLDTASFRPGALFIAEPNDVIIAALAPHLDTDRFAELLDRLGATTATPAPGVPDVLHRLRRAGVATAVVTNDWQAIAHDQIANLGWAGLFDAVVGSDSGYGAKPDPGMVLGALDLLGIEAEHAAMIGDSSHDLVAARAAGVTAVLVTNGRHDNSLADLADQVITSLADFPT